jgi:hypothetical protein
MIHHVGRHLGAKDGRGLTGKLPVRLRREQKPLGRNARNGIQKSLFNR